MVNATEGAGRHRAATAVIGILGMIALGVLSLSPNGATRMLAWPWWLIWQLALAVPPVLLIASTLRADRDRRTPLPKTLGALLLAVAGTQFLAAAVSAHPRESLIAAFTPVSAAALVLLLAHYASANPRALRLIALTTGIAATAFTFVSLVTWTAGQFIPALVRVSELNSLAGDGVFDLSPDGIRNDRPLGHSNYTAGVALLALPWLVALAWNARRWNRGAWLLATALAFAMLVSTGSRGAIIGLASGAAFSLLLLARGRRWSRTRTIAAAAACLALLAALTLAIPRTRQSVLELVSTSAPNVGDRQRIAMVHVGLRMGLDRWWAGQGPGLVPRVYPEYRHTVDGGVDTALQLHSAPLQLWAETGLPGLLAAGALLAWALARATARRREETTDRAGPWTLAAGVSLAAYAGFSLTDHQLHVPIIAAAVAVNIGALGWPRAEGNGLRGRRLVPSLAALALVAQLVAVLPEAAARRQLARAVAGLEHGGGALQFELRIRDALRHAGDNPAVALGAGIASLRLAYPESDAGRREALLEAARRHFGEALVVEPDLELAYFNLGWLELAARPEDAARHFRAALRLVPDRGGVYFGLGLARLASGDTARAHEAFALEILNDPAFVTSPAWDTDHLAPHLRPAVSTAIALAGTLVADTGHEARTSLAAAREVLHWLFDETASTPPALAAVFALNDSAPPVTSSISGPEVLQAALASPPQRRELLARFIFAHRAVAALTEELDILERLLAQHGGDWRAWILAPEGREPPFARVYRRERPGFAMLAGNMDIPVPVDAFIVQENGLVAQFFGSIFPLRGHLHDPLLVDHVARRDL